MTPDDSGHAICPPARRRVSAARRHRFNLAGLLASVWVIGAGVAPVATAQMAVTVSVEARAAGTPLKRIWSYFGYDEDNYTTSPLGKTLLTTIGKLNPVPSHIRTHFLLNTGDGVASHKWGSTNVYTEDATGKPIYSWAILDGILDTIVSTGNLPLAEIGFMPQALSSHPTPYRNSTLTALDGGCFYPPNDYGKWAALVSAWATHSKARYADAVNAWLWEMWNEPNIQYWNGTEAEYFKLYDYTEQALHAVLPDATLGGPAVIGAATMLRDFLQHCDAGTNARSNTTGTRLDMITFHAKGGVGLSAGHPQMDLGNQLRIHRDAFTTVASFPRYKQTPIVITEADPDGCAACSNAQNAYRNSAAYGAYEVSIMKRSLDLEARLGVNLRGLVTWAFMFDDDGYFSVLRTLATHGIDKPVLNAFKLLGGLNGQRVPATSTGARPLDDVLLNGVRNQPDIDSMATLDGAKVEVLVWSYHDDLVAAPSSPVHLVVSLPATFGASARMTHLRADETHGDAYTVWLGQGSPPNPTAAQQTALEDAMQPVALGPARTIAIDNNGSATIDFDLPRFAVSLLTFTAGNDALAADAGAAGPADAGSVRVDAPAELGNPQAGTGDAAVGAVAGGNGGQGLGAANGGAVSRGADGVGGGGTHGGEGGDGAPVGAVGSGGTSRANAAPVNSASGDGAGGCRCALPTRGTDRGPPVDLAAVWGAIAASVWSSRTGNRRSKRKRSPARIDNDGGKARAATRLGNFRRR